MAWSWRSAKGREGFKGLRKLRPCRTSLEMAPRDVYQIHLKMRADDSPIQAAIAVLGFTRSRSASGTPSMASTALRTRACKAGWLSLTARTSQVRGFELS